LTWLGIGKKNKKLGFGQGLTGRQTMSKRHYAFLKIGKFGRLDLHPFSY